MKCRLCWGTGDCWYCRGDGELRVLRDGESTTTPCGECPPGIPGRCVRCLGSGDQPKDAA